MSMAKWFLSGLLSMCCVTTLFAQIVYDSGYSLRNNQLSHYYKMVSWDDSQYKEFDYRSMSGSNVIEFMNWRAIFPAGFQKNGSTKYPMIVMLHGAGESGRSWQGHYTYTPSDVRYDNNGLNLLHGGQEHRDAVNRSPANSRAFPGIVIFPQVNHSGAWESGWANGVQTQNELMAARIIEYMISDYNADINRVYVHGLSNGAKGTWDFAAKRPDLFAAIAPMSGVGSSPDAMTNVLVTTPLWLFQGGVDTNPNPTSAQTIINMLISKGGKPRYTLYPNTGHGTWYAAYAEPDFFSWLLAQDKRNIYVFGDAPVFCLGESIKLGFSAGFLEYQWTFNGANIPGATTRFYDAGQAGTYTVKFKRTNNQWYESFPINVTSQPASTFTPTLTNTGSKVLPIDISSNNVVDLVAPVGYSQYIWFKDGAQVATTTSNIRNISTGAGVAGTAGSYSVRVKETSGCSSLQSNAIAMAYTSPHVGPTPPVQANATVLSSTQTSLAWSDSPTEEYYEIWRNRRAANGYSSEPYKVVGIVSQNVLTTVDAGLRPNAQYFYRIRAVGGNDARFSNEKLITTQEDTTPPTAPTALAISNSTGFQATLSWTASTDNDQVASYQIFLNSSLAGTSTTTSFVLTGLVPGATYNAEVKAVDARNNVSAAGAISFTTPESGLSYTYYESESSISSLATFDFNQAPVKTGIVNNFDISVRNQNDLFVFSYDGYIQIDDIGAYTFYTSSDDGSRLYINGTMVVENDGLHGTQERSGVYNFASAGRYAIKVTFFENGGGEVLNVQYDPAGSAPKQSIPNAKLFLGNGGSGARMASPDATVSVYPNPVVNTLSVDLTKLKAQTITIYDQIGNPVRKIQVDGAQDIKNIEVSDLKDGAYILGIDSKRIRFIKKN
ncbi:Por secretion system C-terminal sorting domain-containing protein [Ohtaekwangia koreensis]|uniref:Por secretion system C-terminal sorting domain-containing protein n=2 Tax=Ohtaekwangia koreensis TaxID=688867 RepID=A0A1T5M2D2_9BACT|nr:Por secretion system C-terminal sorting domain-containing protein [Ohtaekwangia koreensis]